LNVLTHFGGAKRALKRKNFGFTAFFCPPDFGALNRGNAGIFVVIWWENMQGIDVCGCMDWNNAVLFFGKW
jgi:hypothetical protein